MKVTDLNLDIFTIGLIVVGILTIIALIIIPVDAETREDINDLKDRRDELRELTIDINKLLVENEDDKKILEELLVENKKELKQLKKDSSTSWEAVKAIDDKKIDIIQIEADIVENKNTWNILLDHKNDYFVEQEQIADNIDIVDIKLKSLTFNQTNISKAIGIKLSNSCIVANQNNITTSCPSYKELSKMDSSVQKISGKFITDDNGYFHRDFSPMHNSWKWYDFDDTPRIFVDPPHGMSERIKMITLEYNFGVYFIGGDHLLENNTSSYHIGRYVDNCRNMTLDATDWLETLETAIQTMRMGCPDLNEMEKRYVFHNSTEIDIASSSKWQYKEWVKDTKVRCKQLCTEY